MFIKHIIITYIYLILCLLFITSCSQNTQHAVTPTPGKVSRQFLTPTSISLTSTSMARKTSDTTPTRYTEHILLSGGYHPDDLAFDTSGRLVFSDVHSGTVNRLNANGSVTVLVNGLANPEGLVFLADGTLIIAEQKTNRILALSPASLSLSVLRTLPGKLGSVPCKDGVDGIALDPTTQTLIVPDSPLGTVYRLSLDGKKMSRLTSGISRPVGAVVDDQGNIYVTDECGGKLREIKPNGKTIDTGGFGMLDDVALDQQGNILVTDLKPSIHALIRLRLSTGKREVLASQGFIEPQGLVLDARGDIYLSDDFADKIVEYVPTSTS